MVNLLLQPVFLNLVKGSTDHQMTSDDLYNMWSVATKAKSAIVQGQRLENLSWRLWFTSTIRSKLEMEETRNGKRSHDLEHLDETEVEVESSGNSSSSDCKHSDATRNESFTVLPRNRPLFTSICTSILAEIQDASIRLGQSSGTGGPFNRKISQYNFNDSYHPSSFSSNNSSFPTATTIHHHKNHHQRFQNNQHEEPPNSISPPSNRAKSPASHSSHLSNSKKKKNVEKFLKKYRTNLEDITEQFDDKLGFTDDDEDEKNSENQEIVPSSKGTSGDSQNNHSPTSHFATDEDAGHHEEDLFKFSEGQNQEPPETEKKVQLSTKNRINSMISKLLKGSSPRSAKSNISTEPRSISPTASNASIVNEHLEQLASNRFDRFNIPSLKSPIPSNDSNIPPPISDRNNQQRKDSKKLVLDLSSSLSTTKFQLEDEYDSQTIIW